MVDIIIVRPPGGLRSVGERNLLDTDGARAQGDTRWRKGE